MNREGRKRDRRKVITRTKVLVVLMFVNIPLSAAFTKTVLETKTMMGGFMLGLAVMMLAMFELYFALKVWRTPDGIHTKELPEDREEFNFYRAGGQVG